MSIVVKLLTTSIPKGTNQNEKHKRRKTGTNVSPHGGPGE